MGSRVFVPRWLYQQVDVNPGAIIYIDPGAFANTEVWDWHLHWLSFAGIPVVDGAGFNSLQGGIANRILFEIGMSQYGDFNMVPIAGTAIASHPYPIATLVNVPASYPPRFQFPIPYILPKDQALVCQVTNLDLAQNTNLVGFLANCYRVAENGGRRPVQLAGHVRTALLPNTGATLTDADLLNDGENDLHIYEMMLGAEEAALGSPYGLATAWRINPSVGVNWMPNPAPIPAGLIAPFNRLQFDQWDRGPRAYEFPRGTILRRRQRVSVRLQNISAILQSVHLCLFGYLEVT